MKHFWTIFILLAFVIPANGFAQEEEQTEATQNPASDQVSTDMPIPPESETATAESAEEEEDKTVDEMIQFFDGLMQAVAAHEGDCPGMSQSLAEYYNSHKTWIDALDFATVNANADSIEKMRTMADDFGKLLSVCYNSEDIPALLMKYSKL